MLTPEQKRIGVRLAVLLTPLVMVKAAAMLLAAPGPRSAAAAPAPAQNASAAAGLTTSPEPVATVVQQSAADHALRLSGRPVGPSPFYFHVADETDQPAITASGMVDFTVGAIMATSDGNTALINGQLLRVGQEVGDDCVIIHIDNDKRSVTVRHSRTGEELTRHVNFDVD